MQVEFFIQKMIEELDCKELNEMFSQIKTGKMLRSKLILKISEKSDDEIYKLCSIIELIHLASLLHDDVIDGSFTRRGNSSINALYGAKNAIMIGDILYSKAFYELCNYDKKISRIISNAVSKLSIGELIDEKMSLKFNVSDEKYIKMIYLKTAVLIEACAMVGAILSNKSEDDFKEFGKNLGIAFQIVDDILDVTGDSNKLGKPVFNDFKEGKTTLPYIYLYDAMSEDEQASLLGMFKKELDSDDINWLKAKFDEYEIIKECKKMADNYIASALNSIKDYDNKDLISLATSMVDREF